MGQSGLHNDNWIFLLIAIVCIGNAMWGLASGSATFGYSIYTRSDNPLLYWTGISISAAFGVGAVLALVL